MKSTLVALIVVIAAVSILPGCPKKPEPQVEVSKNYDRELPPGALALRKITDPAEIPDFTAAFGNQRDIYQAIDMSLDYLSKPSSKKFFPYGDVTHDQAVASLKAFREMIATVHSPAKLNQLVRERFDVYISVGCDDHGTVRFTGYYTPILAASRTPTAQFKYPLYKLPAGSKLTPDGTVAMQGKDRRALEQGNLLAGNELAYLSDAFEVYIAQVQGSAILRFPDNTKSTVGFAGFNGMEYHSIRDELLKDGKISKETISLRAMIEYFKANPGEVQTYTWRNPRYVFFQEIQGNPRGCLNEPVTTMRSIATDKGVFPRACLAFFNTTTPSNQATAKPWSGFVLDQDRGGAIRAAGRCDIYMGVGDQAGELAGRVVQDGQLYYLFLKPTLVTPPALAPAAGTPTAAMQQ